MESEFCAEMRKNKLETISLARKVIHSVRCGFGLLFPRWKQKKKKEVENLEGKNNNKACQPVP